MADKNKSSKSNVSRGQAAPVRYRCKVGGEWKPLSSFSQNQQKLIQRQTAAGGRNNAANSGMTCREHSAVSRVEIRCEVCDKVKSEDQFSKRAKKNDENICMRCMAWTETQEPEVNPAPLEDGHESAEEEASRKCAEEPVYAVDFHQTMDKTEAPVEELSSQALAPSGSTAFGHTSQVGRERNSPSLASFPPHLRGREPLGSILGQPGTDRGGLRSPSILSSESETYGEISLPLHLQGLHVLSASQADGADRGNGPSSVSTATTWREDREWWQPGQRIEFNAWGPDGRQHRGAKTRTAASSAGGNFERVAGSASVGAADPWKTSAIPAKRTRGRGNWHKAPRLSATELRKPDEYEYVSALHIDPDKDQQLLQQERQF